MLQAYSLSNYSKILVGTNACKPIFIYNCSSSCGLFVLKLMEEFTGHELAHPVTQVFPQGFKYYIPNNMNINVATN